MAVSRGTGWQVSNCQPVCAVTPEERSKKLREFVDNPPKVKKPKQGYDPIEDAMNCNPTLTREEALKMARAFGFY